jgi:hypothetical protein
MKNWSPARTNRNDPSAFLPQRRWGLEPVRPYCPNRTLSTAFLLHVCVTALPVISAYNATASLSCILQHRRWKHHVSPIRWYSPARLCGVTTQKYLNNHRLDNLKISVTTLFVNWMETRLRQAAGNVFVSKL